MMRQVLRLLACVLLGATVLLAQGREQLKAKVGMRAYIDQLPLKGSELVPAPSSPEADVAVRIVKTWPHFDDLSYDLEWVGFEPGTHNLIDFLVRKDGSSTEGLEAIEIEVSSFGVTTPPEASEIAPAAPERLNGYSTEQIAFGVLWGAGFLAILFVGRKWARKPLPAAAPPTLADRLRPLVEEVASGNADNAKKAELERLLVACWRARLGLGSERAVDAIMAIRKHEEAGALLRQVEAWLHAPEPPKSMDVAGLLRPYQSITADSFAPIASRTTGSHGGGA
ncbi:MAG: hypothetical protein ACI89X_000555 [Planctomycetota bacterium]|jgi:hypothetical protein